MSRPSAIAIRRANRSDLAFILRQWKLIVGELVAGHAHFRPSRFAPEIARVRLLSQMEDPDSRVLVALLGPRRLGFINASLYDRSPFYPKEEVGLIENLYVEPGLRRHRVGSRLLREAIGWFRSRGIRAIEAVTAGHNPDAAAFFGSHGFDLLSVTLLLDLQTARARMDAAAGRTRRLISSTRRRRAPRARGGLK